MGGMSLADMLALCSSLTHAGGVMGPGTWWLASPKPRSVAPISDLFRFGAQWTMNLNFGQWHGGKKKEKD